MLQAFVTEVFIPIRAVLLEPGQVIDKIAQNANFGHDQLQHSPHLYRLLLDLPHTLTGAHRQWREGPPGEDRQRGEQGKSAGEMATA